MNPSVRRAVAYIAARIVTRSQASSVYDFSEGLHANFSGEVSRRNVAVYDFSARSHISGGGNGELSLYHFGVRGHLSLKVEATGRVSGYDFSSRSHFNGTVAGNSVSLYDFGSMKFFNYSI